MFEFCVSPGYAAMHDFCEHFRVSVKIYELWIYKNAKEKCVLNFIDFYYAVLSQVIKKATDSTEIQIHQNAKRRI